jgi:hypothetical protein
MGRCASHQMPDASNASAASPSKVPEIAFNILMSCHMVIDFIAWIVKVFY